MLFDALWRDDSAVGIEFAQDYERLYQRWHRLAVVVVMGNGGVTPFGALNDTERVLDLLELPGHRNSYYPKPKPPTAEEQACLELRATIVGTASIEIYVNLGSNLELLGGQNWMTWEDVCSYLLKLGNEPFGNANPNLEKKHRRRRQIIVNYRKEVATICERWRLNAWWAVPAIILHHFFRAENGSIWDPTIPPLSMYTLEPKASVALPVTVKLPGRTEEQFERDKAAILDRAETTIIQAPGGPIRVIRSHFSREEHANWERSIDSACVLLDWDGRRHLLQSCEAWSDPLIQVTPGDFMVEQWSRN